MGKMKPIAMAEGLLNKFGEGGILSYSSLSTMKPNLLIQDNPVSDFVRNNE